MRIASYSGSRPLNAFVYVYSVYYIYVGNVNGYKLARTEFNLNDLSLSARPGRSSFYPSGPSSFFVKLAARIAKRHLRILSVNGDRDRYTGLHITATSDCNTNNSSCPNEGHR